jgi:hypothetical protein
MWGRRGIRPVGEVSVVKTGDPKLDRAQQDLADKINVVVRRSFSQAVPLQVHLVEGLNKLGHGLGVPVTHFVVAALPTTGVLVSSAQAENPAKAKQVWVRLEGVAEIDALIFLLPTVG